MGMDVRSPYRSGRYRVVCGSDPDFRTQTLGTGFGTGPVTPCGFNGVTHGTGESKVKVMVNHPLPALRGEGLTALALRVGWHVWVKLYTPAGFNLFEKSCPRLRMTWEWILKIIDA